MAKTVRSSGCRPHLHPSGHCGACTRTQAMQKHAVRSASTVEAREHACSATSKRVCNEDASMRAEQPCTRTCSNSKGTHMPPACRARLPSRRACSQTALEGTCQALKRKCQERMPHTFVRMQNAHAGERRCGTKAVSKTVKDSR